MLNRKEHKPGSGENRHSSGGRRRDSVNAHRPRRRFIISPKAHAAVLARQAEPGNGSSKTHASSHAKAGHTNGSVAVSGRVAGHPPIDLAETIKTLVQL